MNPFKSCLILFAWTTCVTWSATTTRTYHFAADPESYDLTLPGTLSGDGSHIHADVAPSGPEWNEFFFTKGGSVPPDSLVTLRFKANFQSPSSEHHAYLLVRSIGDAKRTPIFYKITNRLQKVHEVSFMTGAIPDFRIVLGIFKGGQVRLDELSLTTLAKGQLTVTSLPERVVDETSPGRTTYYIDDKKGDDQNPGNRPEVPWKSLEKVNRTRFSPGDTLLFARGGVWQGILSPKGNGSDLRPITIAATGLGTHPKIEAREEDRAAFYLSNQSHWHVQDLELVNRGSMSEFYGSHRFGVYVIGGQPMSNLHLSNLYIHDVQGSVIKNSGRAGAGILFNTWAWFDGIRIENCTLERCDRNGISVSGDHKAFRQTSKPNLRVVIRGNRLKDIGGDGIVPVACKGALIEWNVVSDCHIRSGKYVNEASAGIWPWSCDDTLIQYNEVFGTRFTTDGQGFDSDWNCRNTVFQYNYSHDNEGGFMLICNEGSPNNWNVGNVGTIIRYNISQNDGERAFQIGGPVSNTRIYHNTVYMDKPWIKKWVMFGDWKGWAKDTWFANNIFYSRVPVVMQSGKETGTVFQNNLFFGPISNVPPGNGTLLVDPLFESPGTGGIGLETLKGYALRPVSPALRAGIPIPEAGLRDFFGNPLGAAPPTVGAWQWTETGK